jgi:fructan beta-fructosidase
MPRRISIAVVAVLGVAGGWSFESGHEPFRPAYHFSPKKNWINDPNGLVYFQGEYNLYYQLNPFGDEPGHLSWGHAVARDLLNWKELPVALKEENGLMMFSGSAVVDVNNNSGFGKNGKPPIVAFYTAHREGNQSQNVAYSTDGGRTFVKYSGNPVIDLKMADFRDPMVFWHKPTSHWVMVVSKANERKVQFYSSTDLKKWTLLSEFGPAGASPVPNWECPNFFELPVTNEKGTSKWVLEVGTNGGTPAKGSGSEYIIGDFDGRTFKNAYPASKTMWVDYGSDFYAGQTWSGIPPSDGRRILIAWMSNWVYAKDVPTHPWRGQMSLPRVLSLNTGSDGYFLTQAPIREVEKLRGEHVQLREKSVAAANAILSRRHFGETLEVVAQFTIGKASNVGVHLRKGADQQTSVGFDGSRNVVYVDRTKSGETSFAPSFAAKHDGPLSAEDGKITLHIFLDRCSVEVFGNDGRTTLTDLIFPRDSGKQMDLYSDGGPIENVQLDIWTLSDAHKPS